VQLSNNRKVTVSKWKNQKLVNIREYYEKDGEVFPGKKGESFRLLQYFDNQDVDRIKDRPCSSLRKVFLEQSCRMKCVGHRLCAWSSYVVPKR
jgi:hypothetical protein